MLFRSAGGSLSLFSTRLGGSWNDRSGSLRPIGTATLLLASLLSWGMLTGTPPGHPQIPVLPWFAAFMLANSLRWISISTLTSKVPLPHQRGRYMSVLSAIQHLSSSMGAILSTRLLHNSPDGTLDGMPRLALTSIGLGLLVLPLVYAVERRLPRRRSGDATIELNAVAEGG